MGVPIKEGVMTIISELVVWGAMLCVWVALRSATD